MGKVVEIPADMTARDLCQLLVYKSHCVDDNSWALVEHHPLLGLGKEASPPRGRDILFACIQTHTHTPALGHAPACRVVVHRRTQVHLHACMPTYSGNQPRCIPSHRHVFKHDCMHTIDPYAMPPWSHTAQRSNQVQYLGCRKGCCSGAVSSR